MQLGQLIHVRFEQALELEHDARPALGIGRRPGREGIGGSLHGGVEFASRGQRDPGLDLADIRIVDVTEPARRASDLRAADEMMNLAHVTLLP